MRVVLKAMPNKLQNQQNKILTVKERIYNWCFYQELVLLGQKHVLLKEKELLLGFLNQN